MARVYLIRHGRPSSVWGEEGSPSDPGLDAQGHAQAEAACAALLALPQPPRFVVSSPLRRCRETAAPFARALGLEPQIEPRVAEIPAPEGIAAQQRRAWLDNGLRGVWADIEGDRDYAAWRNAVAAAVADHAHAAIFTHFVAINAALSAALGDERVFNFAPAHASITIFEIDHGILQLIERGRADSAYTLL